MTEENRKIRIAAIGDLHVRESDKGKWSPIFKEASQVADMLLICGDLTDTGDEGVAQVLTEELNMCSIPVAAVLGNHDHEKGRHKLIRHIVQNQNVHILDGECVVIEGIGIAGVKGFGGGFDRHMLSMFGEGAMKAFVQEAVDEALHLDRALSRLEHEFNCEKKIAIMHYSPTKDTVIGEPEAIHPFLGSSRLAEPLARRNVTAAFHGHAHIGTIEADLPGGTKVFNVARHILERVEYKHPFFLYEI